LNASADCANRNVHLTHFLMNFFLINFGLEVRVALCDAALGELKSAPDKPVTSGSRRIRRENNYWKPARERDPILH